MYKVIRYGQFNGKNDGKVYRLIDIVDTGTNDIIIDQFVDKEFKVGDVVEPCHSVVQHKLIVRGWSSVKSL